MLQLAGLPVGLVVALLVFGGVAVALLVVAGRYLRLYYRLTRTPPTPVADLANVDRRVEVVGVARPLDGDGNANAGGSVTAPFSGGETLVCEWSVSERRPDTNDDGTEWRTIASGTVARPFLLDDGTATVYVDPTDADLRLAREETISIAGGEEPPEPIRRFIEGNEDVDDESDEGLGVGPIRVFGGRDRRYVERRLDPGEDCLAFATPVYDTTVADRAGQVNARFDAATGDLLLTDADEATTARRFRRNGTLALVAGLVVLLFVLGMLRAGLTGGLVVD